MRKLLYVCVLVFIFKIEKTSAQNENTSGIYERQLKVHINKDSVSIAYLNVPDSFSLAKVIQKLKPENYPLSIIKKPVFDPFVDLTQQYESRIDEYEQLTRHYTVLDSIHMQKEERWKQLEVLQTMRIDQCKTLNNDLVAINREMSQQVMDLTKVAKDANKGKFWSSSWSAVLGGTAGFAIGILIGALVK
jgi:hypothetical protein